MGFVRPYSGAFIFDLGSVGFTHGYSCGVLSGHDQIIITLTVRAENYLLSIRSVADQIIR